MDYIQAREKVRKLLDKEFKENAEEIIILDDYTISFERGWVFDYNTKAFMKDQSSPNSLIGHTPYLVDKIDGTITNLYDASNPFATYQELVKLYIEKKNSS